MGPLESYFSFDAGEVVLLTVCLRPVVIGAQGWLMRYAGAQQPFAG